MDNINNYNKFKNTFKEDTKFASKYEIDIINKLTGLNFAYDDLILLEKLAGDDYRKKVYLDKTQIGILEFDLIELNWKFTPYPYYYQLVNEKKIILKPTKRRLKGKYLKEEYIKNIEEYNDIIKSVDYFVGIEMEEFLGVGIKRDNRIKLKDLKRKKEEINIKKINDYLDENKKRIDYLVNTSKNILKKYINKYKNKGYVINVSFSGGKDSAVSTLLAKEIIEDIDVLFIDTGLEYPETIRYVKDFAKKYDLNLHTINGDYFLDELDKEGIPTKDNRWCNSVCKLMPLKNFFIEHYPNKKILTIDGSRKFESFARANLDYVRKSGFIEFQTNVFPILDWNAIDVWSYIYLNDVLYNPMYDKGFERIGCYMCPSALNSEFLRVKELYPNLWKKWVNYLKKYYSEDEILRGFWRWDELPPKMREIKRNLKYNTIL
ncbi:phosphoadenosine phosphosulfate reductase [Methanothermococcus okinawensis IH1]|uniref:Phosphoadenosine phosphosulfate reductase n=2 Tax=Methanothermococcus okinawensis TaxID=155863 RepID=F8ALX5_METOI|nr:phosphoadenosine phosphosulfate reductase [Methanothermococcus okinawensis IH1]